MGSSSSSGFPFRAATAWLLLSFLWPPCAAIAQDSPNVCGTQVEAGALPFDKLQVMVEKKVPDEVILATLNRYASRPTLSPDELAKLKGNDVNASDDLLRELVLDDPIYIGWSVIPAKLLRDNYGRYVRQKYFGIDVALANRSKDKGLFVTAFEFCRKQLKEVSSDPALVRGTLVKGEMTGRRSIVLHLIHSTALVLAPIQGFFKNQAHHDNFVTGVNILNPLETGFKLEAIS